MKDSVFLTVVSGVLVFVIGQFIIKLVLEPLVELRKQLGLLSSQILKEINVIVHGDASPEVVEELRRLNSQVLSTSYAIPFYSFFSCILRLPNQKKLIKAARSINVIISDLNSESPETPRNRYESLRSIERELKIKVTYGYDDSKL